MPTFRPGEGFSYSDTGYVVAGILVEHVTGRSLDEVYRGLVFAPFGMEETWLEGHEAGRRPEVAHQYRGELDWTTISPTIDSAGGRLVSTTADLARFVRGLWSEKIVDGARLDEMSGSTPEVSSPAVFRGLSGSSRSLDSSSPIAQSKSYAFHAQRLSPFSSL
jgi:D-alanyl-D-alanine carboxypeptidase